MISIEEKKQLINNLIDQKIISFASERNEVTSAAPYTINLKLLSSYPQILKLVARAFNYVLTDVVFDMIAGPFTDIPLATTISLEYDYPMIFVREERKNHGTERLVEGNYQAGQKVVVITDEIDDVAGNLQLLGRLEGSGLEIVGVYVLLDRGYGAIEAVKEKGYHSQAILALNDIFLELAQSGKISPLQLGELKEYLIKQRDEFTSKQGGSNQNNSRAS